MSRPALVRIVSAMSVLGTPPTHRVSDGTSTFDVTFVSRAPLVAMEGVEVVWWEAIIRVGSREFRGEGVDVERAFVHACDAATSGKALQRLDVGRVFGVLRRVVAPSPRSAVWS